MDNSAIPIVGMMLLCCCCAEVPVTDFDVSETAPTMMVREISIPDPQALVHRVIESLDNSIEKRLSDASQHTRSLAKKGHAVVASLPKTPPISLKAYTQRGKGVSISGNAANIPMFMPGLESIMAKYRSSNDPMLEVSAPRMASTTETTVILADTATQLESEQDVVMSSSDLFPDVTFHDLEKADANGTDNWINYLLSSLGISILLWFAFIKIRRHNSGRTSFFKDPNSEDTFKLAIEIMSVICVAVWLLSVILGTATDTSTLSNREQFWNYPLFQLIQPVSAAFASISSVLALSEIKEVRKAQQETDGASALTLDEWQLNHDGTYSGRVYGKPGFKPGEAVTTSSVRPEDRTSTTIKTETGSVYTLGTQKS